MYFSMAQSHQKRLIFATVKAYITLNWYTILKYWFMNMQWLKVVFVFGLIHKLKITETGHELQMVEG